MDWQDYESVVRYIYEQLGKSANIHILGHGASCKVAGKSGVDHQLDVLTQHSDGIHSYRTAIECKFWKNKVQKDSVTKLAEILEDAKIEKGVIVSKMGFTDDAISFAKYKNIGLVELREPIDIDWEGRIKNIQINISICSPHVFDFEILQPWSHVGERASFNVISTGIHFVSRDGQRTTAQSIIEEQLKSVTWQGAEVSVCETKFPEGTTLTIEGESISPPVEGLRFKVRNVIHETKVEIRGEDYVSMVMHCLFENKSFVISKDGHIRESEP